MGSLIVTSPPMTRPTLHSVFFVCVLALLVAGPVGFGRTGIAPPTDAALTARIAQLVETFLTTDDDAKSESVLVDARALFERDGIPHVSRVGDSASYGFVLINMLGQPPDFRLRFFAEVEKVATHHQLPEDAVLFAEARRRLTVVEQRFSTHSRPIPSFANTSNSSPQTIRRCVKKTAST